MSLQKAVFLLAASLYAVTLLSTLVMLVGIVVILIRPHSVNIVPTALTVGIFCLGLRLVLAVWLRRLGGVPQEYRKK